MIYKIKFINLFIILFFNIVNALVPFQFKIESNAAINIIRIVCPPLNDNMMILPLLPNDNATILYRGEPCPNNQYQLEVSLPEYNVILHLFIILLSF